MEERTESRTRTCLEKKKQKKEKEFNKKWGQPIKWEREKGCPSRSHPVQNLGQVYSGTLLS